MSTQKSKQKESTDDNRYELDHSVDEEEQKENETTILAPLDKQREEQVKLRKLREATVDGEKNLLQLPCSDVSKPDSGNTWLIEVHHPTQGPLQFHVDDVETWHRDEELVQLLNWYDVDQDPYHLQFNRELYVEKNPEEAYGAKDWRLVEPPNYTPDVPRPMSEQLQMKAEKLAGTVGRFTNITSTSIDATMLYGVLTLGVITSIPLRLADVGIPLFSGVFEALLIQLLPFIAATIIGLTLFDPDN